MPERPRPRGRDPDAALGHLIKSIDAAVIAIPAKVGGARMQISAEHLAGLWRTGRSCSMMEVGIRGAAECELTTGPHAQDWMKWLAHASPPS